MGHFKLTTAHFKINIGHFKLTIGPEVGGGGGGHSGTEGGRTFVTYFAEEGVFF